MDPGAQRGQDEPVARVASGPARALRLLRLRLTLPLVLRRGRLEDVLRQLDRDGGGGAVPAQEAEQLVARLFRPLRFWPTTCLWRALGGYAALKAAGAEVRFHIGVRPAPGGDIQAHAWLTRDGRPSVGAPGPEEGYAVAFAWPSEPGRVKMPGASGDPPMALTQSEDVVLTELKDGTGVLLHLGTKFYFALNATGVMAWKLLEPGARDADELAERLALRFPEQDAAAVRTDVAALVSELVAEGLAVQRS
jgi:hypothetical protein